MPVSHGAPQDKKIGTYPTFVYAAMNVPDVHKDALAGALAEFQVPHCHGRVVDDLRVVARQSSPDHGPEGCRRIGAEMFPGPPGGGACPPSELPSVIAYAGCS